MRYLLSLLAFITVSMDAADFISAPTVVYNALSSSWVIDFTVDEATDVTVDVMKGGVVVNHIGSAVLGANPPEPFTPNSLHQTIVWNGKDNFGKTVTDTTGLAFRVRLGLSVKFDKYINKLNRRVPNISPWGIAGLTVDKDRNLYVVATPDMEKGRSSGRLMVYTPGGTYLKTLLPFAADADPAKLEGVVFNPDEGRGLNPTLHGQIQEGVSHHLLSTSSMSMDINDDGQMLIVSGFKGKYTEFKSRSISLVKTNGDIKRGPFFNRSGDLQFAFTPEGDSIYISGFGQFTQYYSATGSDSACVYKCGLMPNSQPRLFAGVRGVKGTDSAHFNTPWGISVDEEGFVYISDYLNKRVKKYNPAGACVALMTVPDRPMGLKVNPKDGSIYVLLHNVTLGSITLRKYSNISATTHDMSHYVGQTALWQSTQNGPEVLPNVGVVMALDHYGDSNVVYLGAASPGVMPWNVTRLAEGATSFVSSFPPDIAPGIANAMCLLTVDQKNDRLFLYEKKAGFEDVSSYIYNGANNTFLNFWATKTTMKIFYGPDGNFYKPSWYVEPAYYQKLNTAGTVIPFVAGRNNSAASQCTMDRFTMKSNLDIGYDNQVLVLEHLNRVGSTCQIVEYDSLGQRGSSPLITGLPHSVCVKGDRFGNVFVAANLKTVGNTLPDYIKNAPFLSSSPFALTTAGAYQNLVGAAYGSVLKFNSEGGAARQITNTSTPLTSSETRMDAFLGRTGNDQYSNDRWALSGLKGMFTGISPVLPNRYTYPGGGDCNCFNPVFDVDGHGRLFVPDAVRHCVYVLDNNMNLITMFGSYDNFDNPGGEGQPNRPAIPLEFPHDVACTDNAIYIGNYGSRFYSDWTHSSSILRTVPTYSKVFIIGDSAATIPVAALKKPTDVSEGMKLMTSPNPFNPSVSLNVNLPSQLGGKAWSISIYDISGKIVKTVNNGIVSKSGTNGKYVWDGTGFSGKELSSGQFIVKLHCGSYSRISRIVKIK